MDRRHFLALGLATPALSALLAACGGDDGPSGAPVTTVPGTDPTAAPSGIAHPAGADTLVVRVTNEGGFVPPGWAFVNMPTALISGDGRAFRPGVTTMEFPGPLLAPIGVRTISEAGIQTVLARAQELGLLATPPTYEGNDMIADAPFTVVRLDAADGSFTHSAYALGFDPESDPQRQALADFVAVVQDLDTTVGAAELGTEEIWQPEEYRLQALVVDPTAYAADDVQPTILPWPADTGVVLADAATCVRASAAAVGQILAEATQLTFFEEDGITYQIAATGILPGDATC
jgi:hypothetical protein